ncbi:hypothetical protein BBK14_07985 [Parafrankia soli]|uniref:Uncharacterized protein n=1 Tax=Parafrankia soli TaxID=2599596 RepID=A0A1S1PIT0_9ACTN|nr:hypothetical protein BBK14_07985 [Parafrankia soli]
MHPVKTKYPIRVELDAVARERLGKPLNVCTVDDLDRLVDELTAEAHKLFAEIDKLKADAAGGIAAALHATPHVAITDAQAVAEGEIVDMDGWGVVDFHGKPLDRVSLALHRALGEAFPRADTAGVPTETVRETFPDWTADEAKVPFWGNRGELLAAYLTGAVDTAEDGEPAGYLFATPPIPALGDRPVWVQPNGRGFTAMFPEDY